MSSCPTRLKKRPALNNIVGILNRCDNRVVSAGVYKLPETITTEQSKV